jgi:peptidoglycan-associated lipoprotein
MEKKQQRFLTNVFAVGASFLFLIACSSTTPSPKSAEKASVVPEKRAVTSPQVRTAATNPGSSLEAHREGKTPAVGPLKDIYFDFDKYNLSADARDLLKSHAQWLKNNASSHVEIEGHCDDRGTDEYNLALGAKRAQAAEGLSGDVGSACQPDLHHQLWERAAGLPGGDGRVLATESP